MENPQTDFETLLTHLLSLTTKACVEGSGRWLRDWLDALDGVGVFHGQLRRGAVTLVFWSVVWLKTSPIGPAGLFVLHSLQRTCGLGGLGTPGKTK